ncbi:hypothetical protein PAPYR_900 [Paratrimastix pyriformis]|uniref:Uncharacterized protein n=1 Tax=Paratrimastix pyriformis TaxID=342808 RepID=A0ABQ8UTX5_9EUKA|nr:hypothetical protein PAPYR_900 [Paratrimastix pyriformis]
MAASPAFTPLLPASSLESLLASAIFDEDSPEYFDPQKLQVAEEVRLAMQMGLPSPYAHEVAEKYYHYPADCGAALQVFQQEIERLDDLVGNQVPKAEIFQGFSALGQMNCEIGRIRRSRSATLRTRPRGRAVSAPRLGATTRGASTRGATAVRGRLSRGPEMPPPGPAKEHRPTAPGKKKKKKKAAHRAGSKTLPQAAKARSSRG